MSRPRTCKYCSEKLRRNAQSCEACGAWFEVHETSVLGLYFGAGFMGFCLIVFGNAYYQGITSETGLDRVMQIVFPAVLFCVAVGGLWCLRRARRPRTWVEWTRGAPDFADLKIVEAGGVLPERGAR